MSTDPIPIDSVSRGLLEALREDEKALAQADQALRIARTAYDVSSRRYAAMREAVRVRLGTSPYSIRVVWPPSSNGPPNYRFRYIELPVGDAVTEVLEDSDNPLTLEEIVSRLSAGGLYYRDTRAANAALINQKGIHKSDDGHYSYKPEEESPGMDSVDDLPF